MRLTSRTLDQIHSPIGAAFALVNQRANRQPLLDMSQAAPSHPPADVVIEHIAAVAASPNGAFYCPQEGLPALRDAFAAELRRDHSTGGTGEADVTADDVQITAGCNQAFCLTASALASSGDEVVLQEPFYFNYDMWLRLDGIVPVAVAGEFSIEALSHAITDRTRFLVIVSPGNPTGVTLTADQIHEAADLAQAHGIMLLLDETYRSFRPTTEASHTLYSRPNWRDHVVTLHSFSKDLALPGYRVGAVVGHPDLLAEVMKLLDCVAICAPRIGQEAAIAGLLHAGSWRRDQRLMVASRQAKFEAVMAGQPGGFALVSVGAYFGWVKAPAHLGGSQAAVRWLITEQDVLAIPGTAFTSTDQSMVRFSFANLGPDLLDELPTRLTA